MDNYHHSPDEANSRKAIKKYSGKTAKQLCDKAAILKERGNIDKLMECSIALMNRLKKLPGDELEELKGYVYEKVYDGDKRYIAVKNVFTLKEIYNL